MTFLNHLKLVEYTGWVDSDAHWLTRQTFPPRDHGFLYGAYEDGYRMCAVAKVSALNLPNWNSAQEAGVKSMRDLDNWGGAVHRYDDDGEALMVRRANHDLSRSCVAVFASSETFWIKLVLEMRGS